MYNLPPQYVARETPQYFEDTLEDSAQWQADVYRLAAQLARQAGVRFLVDIGCGQGHKLAQFTGEFALIGYDYGANIEACKQKYNGAVWLEHDLNETPIPSENFDHSVVICADVIEHLTDPTNLLQSLYNAAQTAEYVLVSTPDRERLRAAFRNMPEYGPPLNPCHVREWSNVELQTYFAANGLPIKWAGWTISNDAHPEQVWTSLLVLSNRREIGQLPLTFQPAPQYRKRAKTSSKAIKVWMTPTPSEAGRDTTNAIHQIVCRVDGLLPDYGVQLIEEPDNADVRAAHAGQGSREPVDVAHYHGLYNTADLHHESIFFAINKSVIRNLRTAKIVTAPSEWIADVLRRDMHLSPRIIGWGVDTDEWTPVADPHLYTLWNKARVDGVSDPSPMLELARRVPNMPFLTTFGQGGANVKTIGRQPYEVMKNYVRQASVYLATTTETFGIGTVEAMAAGVPILGFRHGNTAHLVEHGVSGFLAEPGDYAGLQEGLYYCMKYRDRLGANAREAAKQYTWARVAESFADIYREVLEPHAGPKVSIVIPCHNYGQYVGEAITSALRQEAKFDYEVIVVLDRCTDNSAEVVARFPVKALTVDNGSLSKTRNDGIAAARGEYIVLLDADDRIGNEHFLSVLAETLDKDRGLGIAYTGITIMDAEGKLGHLNAWPNGFDFEKQARRQNQIPSCCMFRKEAWARAGGFRPWFKYAEDAEFWTTVLSIGYDAQHVIRDGWFHYRLHKNSASQVHRTGEIREPDWLEFHPWTKDNQRPLAAGGNPPLGSWPVRFYLKPDVSIIIPVGEGHEEAVKDALHSVEGQTHRQWECIVVNDTFEPLDLTGFPWAKVIRTTGGGGAGYARNIGTKHARAPFLVFLDADDILKPTFLEKTLDAYRKNGRYVYTDWMTDDGRGKVEVTRTLDYSFKAVWERPSLHPVTALIPRQWFIQAGGFDESLDAFEDVDLFMKMLTKGFCGVRVPEPLLVYNTEAGFRRKSGEDRKAQFKILLTKRYGAFMEGKQMCDCVDPPKGKPAVAPTPDNLSDYKETYGEAILAKLVSQFAGISPTTFRGPATRVNYGARARDDVFYVWQADIENSDGVFERVELFEPEPVPTVVPPPPAQLDTLSVSEAVEFQAIDIDPDDEPETALEDMTINQLKAYAEANEIDLTGHLKNRATILGAILEAISA